VFGNLYFQTIDVHIYMSKKKVIVIGSGFAGISAASFLAKAGYDVTVLEKLDTPGGRARQLICDGFTFDMGPSWYWMPDIFERYFEQFGKKPADYYELIRLDPSYSIFFGKDNEMLVPAKLDEFYAMFEKYEPGSSVGLKKFLKESAYKYEVGIKDFVFRPGNSVTEFIDPRVIKSVFNLHMFQSIAKYIRKHFSHPELIKLLEFPVLFLGATPQNTPALYSLMNYADITLGTWYPKGGMYSIVKGMVSLAEELGVKFEFNQKVSRLFMNGKNIHKVLTQSREFEADIVVGGADYHHVEQHLLDAPFRMYSQSYWDKRVLAPSSILYYIGVKGKLKNIQHHTLFFDAPFETHAKDIYENPKWPDMPLFYTSCASKTDPDCAPEGCENMVFLIPVAPGLKEDKSILDKYFKMITARFDELTGNDISSNIIFRQDYGYSNFVEDYNSLKGNAYGLANTIMQTAFLKPKMVSRKVDNLYYTGQLTTPGPGVPPSLISGEVVSREILKRHHQN
jgi:phytoene desaturase